MPAFGVTTAPWAAVVFWPFGSYSQASWPANQIPAQSPWRWASTKRWPKTALSAQSSTLVVPAPITVSVISGASGSGALRR